MTPELLNVYIDRLLQEIDSLNKNRFILESRLKCTEILNEESQKKISELELQLEKNIKKNAKKEVNTSETF